MIVVAVDGLAAPRIKRGTAGILDLIAVTIGLESLRYHSAARRINVWLAVPSHWACVIINGTKQFQLHTSLGYFNYLGKMGDASIVAICAAKNITHLGSIDHGILVD
jgi:hypothetical protein